MAFTRLFTRWSLLRLLCLSAPIWTQNYYRNQSTQAVDLLLCRLPGNCLLALPLNTSLLRVTHDVPRAHPCSFKVIALIHRMHHLSTPEITVQVAPSLPLHLCSGLRCPLYLGSAHTLSAPSSLSFPFFSLIPLLYTSTSFSLKICPRIFLSLCVITPNNSLALSQLIFKQGLS
ncbi:hypothetical protein BsWGS_13593 [Bradybaena similaris]